MKRPVPTGDYESQSSIMADVLVYHYGALPSIIGVTMADLNNPLLWRSCYKPFAVAIVQPLTNNTTLVRDHWGISPLYYCRSQDQLIFGQSIPDIIKHLPNTPLFAASQIKRLFTEPQYDDSGETLYQGIYRVPPGHMLHFKPDGTVTKEAFWQLERHGPTLYYTNDDDYLEHFSLLMQEALLNATENQTNIAAEFSAGLDSSAIYCAARNMKVTPKLFMHVNLGTDADNQYNDHYENAVLDHYQIKDIARIGADDFDPLQVLTDYASLFAGPAPYLFFMFASPLHRAVSAGKHPVLLSGFGGDQCVSCQLSPHFFIPELIHQGAYSKAWRELSPSVGIKKGLRYAAYSHAALYALQLKIKKMRRQTHPYERIYYKSAREVQWSLLQGPDSYEVRMRIEYSSLVSKNMGFEYRYPLLYPKLVEFMLSLPTDVNRRDGRGRYLIRQYLSKNIPKAGFNTYRKQEGLGIVPAAFDTFKQNYQQGHYQDAFNDLPYPHLIQHPHAPTELSNRIKGFMLKRC